MNFKKSRLYTAFFDRNNFTFSWQDTAITVTILLCAAVICTLLRSMDDGDIYVAMIFLLAVAIVSRFTNGYAYGLAASLISVIGINYVFTAPYYEFSLSISGYPLSFASMLIVSLITSAMTTQIKAQEKQRYKVQIEEMRANLLRAVSHDLRTPLTSISGAASVLVRHPEMTRDRQETLLKEIIDDSDWLVRMVENLLSITRINAEPANLIKKSEAAEEVISESVRKFRKRFKNLPVEICLPPELIFVPMDAILIEQVITNLLENVAAHGETATRCWIRLTMKGDDAVFSVEDDGVGIPPRQLPTIFESSITRPYQPTSDGNRNMGIGLSVCRAIILAHGGRIEAGNRPEGGACFRFYLPVKEANHEFIHNYSDR